MNTPMPSSSSVPVGSVPVGNMPADATVDTVASEPSIAGLSQPVITQYFQTLNAGDFEATARLFAEEGALYAPFESAVVGPEAIAAYLKKEAKGIKALPHAGVAEPIETGDLEIKVTGKVQTSLFTVNVAWYFVLDAQAKILAVRVKLLAALEELLHLKQ